MPKIFLFAVKLIDPDPHYDGDWLGYAIAEDGTRLACSYCTKNQRIYLPSQLRQRVAYELHYPDGYELVNLLELTDKEQEAHEELQHALDLGIAKYEQAQQADQM